MGFSEFSDTWESGDPYEKYVGRWSRRVAPLFLAWLDQSPGRQWLDVGCGTGALCSAILAHCSPKSVTGVDPSDGFLRTAKSSLGNRAELRVGTATELPFEDAQFDTVVSGLVLNFVAEPLLALAEMARVARRDGIIGAYVWDYAGKMEMLRLFWDCAVELDPAASALDEGRRFPICDPEALRRLFSDAGVDTIATTPIDVVTSFAGFDDYWRPFLGGQGPAPSYASLLDDTQRARLRDRIRSRLSTSKGGEIGLTARAWAICATNRH